MLMQKATPEMVERWKEVWNDYKDKLRPNRKCGKEVVEYLKNKYFLEELHDDNVKQVVINNILYNKPYADRLSVDVEPSAVTFIVKNKDNGKFLYENQDEIFKGNNIFVGVELESGFFCVEGSSLLWDELYVFRGLDEKDIQNYFCVGEYISCLKKFRLLESII
ncbi:MULTISPECIES: hypothetical protein [unclassified Clostridium]|uniref:hypothetical protein n=1 Tax=unclassified Clostridium TaxID=2614128 RepID=UPI000297B9B1|nr:MULTISPECIES: hypothetical protein [unclassified Clostridium]EKQ52787.1 MAG: hypothetical protein A370_04030 [Clostridium sp. Maddingley MBC34-26]